MDGRLLRSPPRSRSVRHGLALAIALSLPVLAPCRCAADEENSPVARDAARWSDSAEMLPPPELSRASGESPLRELPPVEDFELPGAPLGPAWWDASVQQPLHSSPAAKPISLDTVLLSAMSHSAQIRVIQETPLIRQTAVTEALAGFDWTSFVESQWIDTSEPVGNRLTTGGPTRFRDEYLSASGGVRRRNRVGGQFEVAQQIGHQQNNSLFFDPPNQGNSRLTFSYTQPLLRGAGREFNTSLIVLANIDTDASRDEVAGQLQSHLLEVTRAYWGLYLERGVLLQKRRFYTEAASVLRELEQRRNIDALQSQILRSCAAVESRKADILRAEMSVRNAESRIRSLVNDPALGTSAQDELVPTLPPLQQRVDIDLPQAVETALQNRPEIAQAIQQIQAAGVRLKMSRNELLPAVNLVLETYVAGLRGNSQIGQAWLDQYREGEPSYSVGLQYERPFGNRAAQARFERRRHELNQLQAELQATLEAVRLEVEIAVREVQTTYREMMANYRAMEAAATEVDYIADRWQLSPEADSSASILLDHLLQAQERLTATESAYLHAQLNYSLSQMAYRKAIGMLLKAEDAISG